MAGPAENEDSIVEEHDLLVGQRAAERQHRLLYRLWLAMPNSRTLPEGHEVLWRTTAAGALRGGIGQVEM